jgi:hypothetical protein
VCVQLYETDKISSGLFLLQWSMIKIVDRVPGWCEWAMWCVQINIMHFTRLTHTIPGDLCLSTVISMRLSNVSCGLFLLQRLMIWNCGTIWSWYLVEPYNIHKFICVFNLVQRNYQGCLCVPNCMRPIKLVVGFFHCNGQWLWIVSPDGVSEPCDVYNTNLVHPRLADSLSRIYVCPL